MGKKNNLSVKKNNLPVKKNNFLLKKLGNFSFAENTSNLYIRRTWSNIFVTITDHFNKVIICKSSGQVIDSKNKRLKKAPQSLESIVLELNEYFKQYNILKVNVILRSRITQHIYTLVRELLYHNILISSFSQRFAIPYSKVRGRNKRRK